jgi:hypothetical protein
MALHGLGFISSVVNKIKIHENVSRVNYHRNYLLVLKLKVKYIIYFFIFFTNQNFPAFCFGGKQEDRFKFCLFAKRLVTTISIFRKTECSDQVKK